MIKEEYFSHGKLLLSGEFLVLEGATALAMPLKHGQHLSVTEGAEEAVLHWTSDYKSQTWFEAKYKLPEMELIQATDPNRSRFIQKLLLAAVHNNHLFAKKLESKKVVASLEFDPDWGWGSSSTLISNIAYWSETNPFELLFETQEGSGYDIACARASSPILYAMNGSSPYISEVEIKESIIPYIYFIYLGHKQSTADGIKSYRQSRVFDKMDIQSISGISMDMVRATDLNDFNALIREHERIISKVIHKRAVKEEYFSDFPGEVKSLGTWGGDFVMMTYAEGKEKLTEYLHTKKLDKLFPYEEIAV